MALNSPDDLRDVLLGSAAGTVSVLVGLTLLGVIAMGQIELLERTVVVSVLIVVTVGYGVAGLYDIVALGVPKRGVAHLVAGAGLVLVLLAPFGDSHRLFALTGAGAILLSGLYHVALATDIVPSAEEHADEI